jgi:hypothetical protein
VFVTDPCNASHKNLGRAPHDDDKDAENTISYSSLSPPVQAKVCRRPYKQKCTVTVPRSVFCTKHYCNGEEQNEDFIFRYVFQKPTDTYGQCANTNEDERALLKYMAEIWCLLLEKAERVYAWGTIEITLPSEWFVLSDVFAITLDRRNALLQRLGWQIRKTID